MSWSGGKSQRAAFFRKVYVANMQILLTTCDMRVLKEQAGRTMDGKDEEKGCRAPCSQRAWLTEKNESDVQTRGQNGEKRDPT